MITLHSIWCDVLDDRAIPAHDIIPEAMRRVTQECARLMTETHAVESEALNKSLEAIRALKESSYQNG